MMLAVFITKPEFDLRGLLGGTETAFTSLIRESTRDPGFMLAAVQLSWEHGDPSDRMVVATARTHEAVLVTADARITEAKLVRCVWD